MFHFSVVKLRATSSREGSILPWQSLLTSNRDDYAEMYFKEVTRVRRPGKGLITSCLGLKGLLSDWNLQPVIYVQALSFLSLTLI